MQQNAVLHTMYASMISLVTSDCFGAATFIYSCSDVVATATDALATRCCSAVRIQRAPSIVVKSSSVLVEAPFFQE